MNYITISSQLYHEENRSTNSIDYIMKCIIYYEVENV